MIMKVFITFLFTALIVSSLQIARGQNLSFSLEEARAYAVEYSYNVKSASLDVQIAEKKVKETMAIGLPQLDAYLDYNYFINQPVSLLPGEFAMFMPGYDSTQGIPENVEVQFGTKHNANFGLTLNQLIFDGRYFIGLQYSKVYKSLSQRQLIKSELDVKALVSETYYSILIGEESLKILDSTFKVLEQTLYEISEMYKEGFVEETDVDQLTLTITDIQNSINIIGRQNEIGYNLLKYQMGIPLDQDIVLSESLDQLLESIAVEAALGQSFVMEDNIDYKLVKGQEEMKVLNLKNEKAAYLPSINGFLTYTQNAQRETFSFTQGGQPWFASTSTGLSMNIPIFSSGSRKARVGQAKLELEKIRTNLEEVEQGLELSVLQARSALSTAVQNFYREERNVELSLKIYRKTLIKYAEGVSTSAELTQQHNQFLDAETRYFQIALVMLNAKNQLDKIMGNY